MGVIINDAMYLKMESEFYDIWNFRNYTPL